MMMTCWLFLVLASSTTPIEPSLILLLSLLLLLPLLLLSDSSSAHESDGACGPLLATGRVVEVVEEEGMLVSIAGTFIFFSSLSFLSFLVSKAKDSHARTL
jgi:hypothetical protein